MAKHKKGTRKDRARPVHIIQRQIRRKERQDEACSHLKNSETSILQGHQKKVDFSHLFKKTEEKEEVHSFDQEFGLIDH